MSVLRRLAAGAVRRAAGSPRTCWLIGRAARTVTIVTDHRVGGHPVLGGLPLSVFDRQLERLARRPVVDLMQALRYLEGEETLPAAPVVITFDDGTRDNYVHAFPRLRRLGLPATIFLSTAGMAHTRMLWTHRRLYLELTYGRERFWREVRRRCEKEIQGFRPDRNILRLLPRDVREPLLEACWLTLAPDVDEAALARGLYLSWDEVREMAAGGVTFGSHAVSHPFLAAEPERVVEEELRVSRDRIAAETGRPCEVLAYPFGAHTPRVSAVAASLGYRLAVSDDDGINRPPASRYALRRVRARNEPDALFAYRVSPARIWVRRMAEAGASLARTRGARAELPGPARPIDYRRPSIGNSHR